MKKKFLAFLLIFLFSISFTTSSSSAATEKPKNTAGQSKTTGNAKRVRSEAGLNMPDWGVAIDAVYDSRLDNLIPGYKIMNVVLTNRSASTIYLDPRKDKWVIRDNVGKSHEAVNHLRFVSEKLWLNLPTGLKEQLEYPHAVRTGNSTKIDLFFPVGTELSHFREISWRSEHFDRTFDIYTAMEKNLDWDKKSEITPKSTPSLRQAIEKYEGTADTEENPVTPPTADSPPQEPAPGKEAPQFDPTLDSMTIPMD